MDVVVGQIYKGWEILGIRKGGYRGKICTIRCKCGLQKERELRGLKQLSGEQGCMSCTNRFNNLKRSLIGEKIGTFVIIQVISTGEKGCITRSRLRCIVCNIEITTSISNKKQNPGCMHCKSKKTRVLDIGGKVGKWTIIKKEKDILHKKSMYLCKCECGRTAKVLVNNLATGRSKQCRSCSATIMNLKRYGHLDQPKTPKLSEYDNVYLNFCIQPRPIDDIIEHTGLSLHEVQDQLIDLQLEGKIEINREGLWETL